MRKWMLVALLAFFAAVPPACLAWQGKVTAVIDGDSIEVLHDGMREPVRLYGVDCPEMQQEFGERAKGYTAYELYGRTVEVAPIDRDDYGRTVAMIVIDGRLFNPRLIEAGLAWVYNQYCKIPECREWSYLEQRARSAGVGLWAAHEPVPPWLFRRMGNRAAGSAERLKPGKVGGRVLEQGTYHGSVADHVFHAPGCKYYECEGCIVIFQTREEAQEAGYRPCDVCRP